jgi:hypothetical protein
MSASEWPSLVAPQSRGPEARPSPAWTLAALIRGAFDEGVAAERKRIGEIIAVPGASRFAELAADLAVGGATAAQVSAVIARMEVAVQARIHPTESSPLESASRGPTIH